MAHYSRKGYKREPSPNLLPRPDNWEAVPSSPSSSLADKFSLSPDPTVWGSDLSRPEPDDNLHNPEIKNGKFVDGASSSGFITGRGVANIGCLAILAVGLVALFLGYPVVHWVEKTFLSSGTSGLPVNATGQIASIGNFGLIDLDTPFRCIHNKIPLFRQRDEAVDLHYWATNNMEWYDPLAVTTANGALRITLSATENHNLSYTGGLVTTWNKFCFTGGLLITNATLPGTTNIHGFWPAFWTMGNLGRAGYGASLDGMWPYTYDACDVGTAPNQTLNGIPEIATTSGSTDQPYNGELSYLSGQRLSRCTCPGESHPGPIHASDGSYVGRSAPEIDVFEAQIQDGEGAVSQSGQWAPFNAGYVWLNTSDNMVIADHSISAQNTYIGGAYQQATSVVTKTNQRCYEMVENCYSAYGIEYKPGFNDAYISWISDNKVSWTVNAAGLDKDPLTQIDARPVPQEPMYILANLGMSQNFGGFDPKLLTFPATLSLDYVRVYQYEDSINIGCDPPDFPTQEYINTYIEAYTNPLLTTWVDDYKQTVPKNKFVDGGC
ncbi:Glycoside hydrolase family 16 protein [Mycena venus]|uniref:Glycoside hydrolase family 16 protein n=1 Tax=Mycena venus TaxID=2733690 RepID=A0A8H6YYW4_9AGAR|nr:Glycoside hydrolase family 16 protein [Mycena venus]